MERDLRVAGWKRRAITLGVLGSILVVVAAAVGALVDGDPGRRRMWEALLLPASLAGMVGALLLTSLLRRVSAEAPFRALAEAMPHVVWSARPNGHFDYVNSRFLEVIGSPVQRHVTAFEFVHPEDLERARAAWREALQARHEVEARLRLRRGREGGYRWFLVRAAPLRDAGGEVVRWVGTCTDVHEGHSREALVQTLFQFGEALSGAVTVSEVARAACEWGRRVLGAEHALVGLLTEDGTALRALAGIGVGERYVGAAPLPLDAPAAFCAAARTGTVVWVDSAQAREELYPLTRGMSLEGVAAAPLKLEGRVLGAWSIGFNQPDMLTREQIRLLEAVTSQCAQAMERARLYDAERQSRAAAEQANEAKVKFLRIMSHDLRTPLNAILGYTELLQGGYIGPLEARQLEFLARIRAGTELLRTQIEEVLEFARIEAGHVQVARAPVGLASVLERVLLVVVPQATSKGIVLLCEPAPPEATMLGDEHRVVQILMNLVANAVKFTPAGGDIELATSVGPDTVRLTVSDTGPGIPEDAAERIFEPFVQVDSGPVEGGRGIGLGLAICRELARAMGGDVGYTPRPGGGSVFTLALPAGRGR